jgi:hypothetical protein
MNYAFTVCGLTFLNLLHLGAYHWEILNTTKLIPEPNRHGNEGNSARVTSTSLGASRDSLMLYLKETGERQGEPHATRFIRMKAGMELSEGGKGAIYLPSHITKRKLYELWVWSRGWRVTSDNKGSYPPNQPIETLFQQIQDARAFAVAGGQPYGNAMIINVAYTLVFNTGLFPDACRSGQSRAITGKTWAQFKIDFATAHREFRLTNQTEQQSGFHSASMMI